MARVPVLFQRYRLTLIRLALAAYWLTLAIITHSSGINADNTPRWEVLPFDKTMHVLSFAGLAVLLMAARLGGRATPLRRAVNVIGVGLAYGVVDELTQPYFGRTRSAADLLADGIGLAFGASISLGWSRWINSRVATRSRESSISPGPRSDPAVRDGQPSRRTDPHRFVGHAVLVGAFTLFSRVTGLVRDASLAAVFGASIWLDAFLIGFLVPNLFRRLFGEGALTAAFIPRYSRLLNDDPALARRFASLCVVLVSVLLAVITLVGEAAMALALHHVDAAGGGDKAGPALRLTMLMLPYMPMVCGVAFLGAILQVHRRFGPPAAAPVLLNLVMIAADAFIWFGGPGNANPAVMVRLIAWSVLVAGVLQLAWLGFAVARTAPLTLAFAGTRAPFLAMLKTMLPMVVGLGVFQINTLIDGLIAYGLAHPVDDPDATLHLLGRTMQYPIEPGAVTVITLAQRLYQFPLGVFGIAIATAIFPALAAAYRPPGPRSDPAEGDTSDDAFGDIVRRGLRLTVFIALPASVGLILVRVPLTRVFFEHGSFSEADALRTATLVGIYSAAVWAYSMTHVLTRAFYAADDASTPLRVSGAMVALNLTLNLTLIWPLGVAGLAWSTAVSAAVQTALLLILVRRHVDRPVDADVLGGWSRVTLLSAVMGVVLFIIATQLDLMTPHRAAAWGQLALLVAAGAAVYFGGAVLLRMPEMRWLRRRSRSTGT